MVIKIVGLGILYYFKDRYNAFDCAIVLISTVDVVFSESKLNVFKGGKAL